MYGNRDLLGAFAKLYGNRRRIDSSQAHRRLSGVLSKRPRRLVPLDDTSSQKRLDLHGRISISMSTRSLSAGA